MAPPAPPIDSTIQRSDGSSASSGVGASRMIAFRRSTAAAAGFGTAAARLRPLAAAPGAAGSCALGIAILQRCATAVPRRCQDLDVNPSTKCRQNVLGEQAGAAEVVHPTEHSDE